MNRLSRHLARTLVSCAALLAVPACAAKPAPLTMTVNFDPAPVRQGAETITVILQDARHKPVSGADVTIASSMPTMSMAGAIEKASPLRAGVYVAKMSVNFATRWTFDVKASAGKRSIHRSYTEDVK